MGPAREIQKARPTDLAGGLKMEYEMERRVRLDSQVFGLRNWETGFALR